MREKKQDACMSCDQVTMVGGFIDTLAVACTGKAGGRGSCTTRQTGTLSG
jgi:hypothetical protein